MATIHFEPAFVEEAVFWEVNAREAAGEEVLTASHHAERNRIYEAFQGEERDRNFQKFYEQCFSQLGLKQFFERTVFEFEEIEKSNIPVHIRRAWSRKQEGAELYGDGGLKAAVLGFRVSRLPDRRALEAFLRHELLHVSDMLDPAFQYRPDALLGGGSEVENDLTRDRFCMLWNLYADVRLMRQGFELPVPFDSRKRDFEKAFAPWGADPRNLLFLELTSGAHFTQRDLIERARDERLNRTIGRGGLKCPLCGFPSFDALEFGAPEREAVSERIRKERPDWEPSMGACRQCFDLYRSAGEAIFQR